VGSQAADRAMPTQSTATPGDRIWRIERGMALAGMDDSLDDVSCGWSRLAGLVFLQSNEKGERQEQIRTPRLGVGAILLIRQISGCHCFVILGQLRSIWNCQRVRAGVESVYSISVGRIPMKFGSNADLRRADGRNLWVVRASSLLCLLLLTLVTFVQVVHVHPANTDADHCPICVVMHSAAPVAAVAAAIVFVRALAPVPVPVFHSVVRHWHCSLFNRPPPTRA